MLLQSVEKLDGKECIITEISHGLPPAAETVQVWQDNTIQMIQTGKKNILN